MSDEIRSDDLTAVVGAGTHSSDASASDKHAPTPDAGTGAPGGGSSAGPTGNQQGAEAAGNGAHAHAAAAVESDEDTAVEVEEDLDELVETARQRDQYLALAQRTQADFENYRKRVAKEAAAAKERGVCALAKELLPALDNLDRALEAAAKDDPLLQGVALVRAELTAALARLGIDSFSPAGEQFDPAVHEAVATAPAPDGQASGTVIEVYQDGYRLRDSVIRPARVVVAA
jgi:molecular chaperone GrpE